MNSEDVKLNGASSQSEHAPRSLGPPWIRRRKILPS